MFRKFRLPLAGLLLAPVVANAQAPIVPMDAKPVPMMMPSANPMPMPAPLSAPAASPAMPMPAATPAVEAPAVEEAAAAPEEKFLLAKTLGMTPTGQLLSDRGWKIYGWTQGSYNASSASRNNLPVPFIDRANEFSMNQNWIHVEKTIDTSKKEFQIGGAADGIIPGTDSRFTLARGLFDEQNRKGTLYSFDLYQAYADFFLPNFGANGTTVRVGKFQTFLEYEVVQGIGNAFLSRSYLFQYNPFTHTGVNFLTQIDDNWSMQNGVVLGSDNFIDPASRTTYIGQLKWAPKEGKSSVALGTQITRPSFHADEQYAFYNVYNLQFTHKVSDKLNYIADASFSHIDSVPGIGSANWYGLVQYLSHTTTEKLTTNFRVELFNDSQGFRTGTSGLYTATTFGFTYKPVPYLYLMPEVRYDYASKGTPFEGDKDLFTAAIGAIVRW